MAKNKNKSLIIFFIVIVIPMHTNVGLTVNRCVNSYGNTGVPEAVDALKTVVGIPFGKGV